MTSRRCLGDVGCYRGFWGTEDVLVEGEFGGVASLELYREKERERRIILLPRTTRWWVMTIWNLLSDFDLTAYFHLNALPTVCTLRSNGDLCESIGQAFLQILLPVFEVHRDSDVTHKRLAIDKATATRLLSPSFSGRSSP